MYYIHATMQCFQSALACFATAISSTHQMFMTLTPGHRDSEVAGSTLVHLTYFSFALVSSSQKVEQAKLVCSFMAKSSSGLSNIQE